jgi:hypothetical protein
MNKPPRGTVTGESTPSPGWQEEWTRDLRFFHTSERELSTLIDDGVLSRRAASHLRLCATCRETLAFCIERVIADQNEAAEQLEQLRSFLNNAEAVVRASAARSVVSLVRELPGAIEPLKALLADTDETVREDATMAMGQLSGAAPVTREPAAQVSGQGDRMTNPAGRVLDMAEWRAARAADRARAYEHARRAIAPVTIDVQRRRAVNFADRHVYRWPATWPDGGKVVVHLEVGPEGRVLTVDTIREDLVGRLVHCALAEAETPVLKGETDAGGLDAWMVLHADPVLLGHFHASARLNEAFPLPGECRAAPDAHPTAPPPREVLREAVLRAATIADRAALLEWVSRQVEQGLLSKEVLEFVSAPPA